MPSLVEHPLGVRSARFSRQGDKVISVCDDGKFRIFDATNSHAIFSIKGHYGDIVEAGFGEGDGFVCAKTKDGKTKFWNVQNGNDVTTVHLSRRDPDFSIRSRLSSDGNWKLQTNGPELQFVDLKAEAKGGEPNQASAWFKWEQIRGLVCRLDEIFPGNYCLGIGKWESPTQSGLG